MAKVFKDSFDFPGKLTGGYEVVMLGSYCRHKCFPRHGGCSSTYERDVLNIPQVVDKIHAIISKKSDAKIFLSAPNFFDIPLLPEETKNQHIQLLEKLVSDKVHAYLRVDATVQSLASKETDFYLLLKRSGIKEVWLGVESAEKQIRDTYYKPEFTNEELLGVMEKLQYHGIHGCWYIVTGFEDSDETVQKTVELVRAVKPYKIWVTEGIPCESETMEIKWSLLKSRVDDIMSYRKIYKLLAGEINHE